MGLIADTTGQGISFPDCVRPAIWLILIGATFVLGAKLMLGALAPQPGLETYCVKCGNNLTHVQSTFCPKCRRVLAPEMTVTCTRSAIVSGRMLVGLVLTLAAGIAAVYIFKPRDDFPASTRSTHVARFAGDSFAAAATNEYQRGRAGPEFKRL